MDKLRFAVLIDADNNSKEYIKTVFDEITNEGIITYKRMYGDWTSPNLKSFKDTMLEYSITPMQQYAYTKGKNSTDSAMIIDAMDILYTGKVDGFCLVSSDSDFTKLASRLREAGMIVIGMGKQQTPKAFVTACNTFKFVDVISGDSADNKTNGETQEIKADEKKTAGKVEKKKTVKKQDAKPEEKESSKTPIEEINKTVRKIIEKNSDEDGWMLVSVVGSTLGNKYSDFDTRNYGCRKMKDLLEKLGFEIKKIQDSKNVNNPSGHIVYVRIKK